MATVQGNFVAHNNNYASATWINITEADTGSAVSLVKYPGQSLQVTGNFGAAGAINIEGSNDNITWTQLHDSGGNLLTITDSKIYTIAENSLYTRVRASAGTGVSVTVIIIGIEASSLNGGSSSGGGGGSVTQGTSPWVVSAASLPLPTGAATQATLASILTNLGSPFQAGASIGNSSFAISSVIAGVGATNIGKAEDAAHVSGDTGVFSLGLANEAQTTLANDGDYIGMGHDTKGNSYVIGNAASAATDIGNPVKVGGKYNSAVQVFTNGQRADLQLDQRGGVLIQDGQAIPSVSVTSATTLFTIADTSGYGSISVQVTSAGTTCTVTYEASEDGTTWSAVNSISPGSTTATATTSTAVGLLYFPVLAKQFRARVSTYTSGTVTAQGTLRKDLVATKAVGISGTALFAGTINDGTAVSANAIPSAFEARTTNKTAVTTGQYVRPIATSIGAAVNKPFQVPELDWSYPAAAGGISNTTTAVTMVAAAGAGIRNYITSVQLSAGALGAATEVAIRDGAGGAVIWRGFLSTSGGAVNAALSSPIKSTANTLLEVVTLTATITGAVYVNAQGYQAT